MKHEAVELLSRYLKIYTTNPPGNEDLGKVHGIDERISEENMIKGTEVYIDIVRKLCKI